MGQQGTETEKQQEYEQGVKKKDGEYHNMKGTDTEAKIGTEEEGPTQGNERGETFLSQEWRQELKDAREGKVGPQPKA